MLLTFSVLAARLKIFGKEFTLTKDVSHLGSEQFCLKFKKDK